MKARRQCRTSPTDGGAYISPSGRRQQEYCAEPNTKTAEFRAHKASVVATTQKRKIFLGAIVRRWSMGLGDERMNAGSLYTRFALSSAIVEEEAKR